MFPIEATGALLAGGRGERLGEDKLFARVGGRPLGARVLETIGPCVSELLVSVDLQERGERVVAMATGLDLPPIRIVIDELPGEGPLAAIGSVLSAASHESVFIAACDYPFLEPTAVRLLLEALGDREAALPEIGGRLHPLCGAYSRAVLERLKKVVSARAREAMPFAESLRLMRVNEFFFPGLDPRRIFMNVNTAEDRVRAEEVASWRG